MSLFLRPATNRIVTAYRLQQALRPYSSPSPSSAGPSSASSGKQSEPSSSAVDSAAPPGDQALLSGLPVTAKIDRSGWPPNDKEPPQEPGNVPIPTHAPLVAFPMPPFHTHEFFAQLRVVFPEPVARLMMKATRALLVYRVDRMNGEMLNRKDQDNQAYLFRAALSELRTEMTMRTRNEFAALQTTTSQLRREADSLEGKMKEDVATLKNDLQMDIDNRKHDSRADLTTFEMAIEDLANKMQIKLSDIRTVIEKAKWHNTQRGLGLISSLVVVMIVASELNFRKEQRQKDEKKRKQRLAQQQSQQLAEAPPHELE
ncbi:hypothetical protein BKA62DRAFT_658317, partial [Auriculariales sp. MPI-PUGE-AT-0066]